MEWRDVVGWGDLYQVSDAGMVRSKDRKIFVFDPWGVLGERNYRGRTLRIGRTPKGYETVSFTAPGRKRHCAYVHDLVTAAFVGPKPEGLEVRHFDGVRHHNHKTNLRYGTRSQNALDRHRHGTMNPPKGELHPCAKLTEAKVREIRRVRPHVTLQEIADDYGVSNSTISAVEHRKSWKHIA